MSLLKAIKAQLGLSNTATNNFTLTAEAADGTMKLARGNAGATTQDILTVDVSGNVVFPQKVSQGAAQSMIRVGTPNGYGSTNTKIQRWTTTLVSQGTDITYADSATLGGTFTINTAGVYAMNLITHMSGANAAAGISVDSSQLTTSIGGVNAINIVSEMQTYAATAQGACGNTLYLAQGAVVRVHTDGSVNGGLSQFSITKVA